MEYLSIKEIADKCGVSKTAIRKKITALNLDSFLFLSPDGTGKKLLPEQVAVTVLNYYGVQTTANQVSDNHREPPQTTENNRKQVYTTANQVSENLTEKPQTTANLDNSAVIEILREQLRVKDEQIAKKDEQIERLQNEVDNLNELHRITQEQLTAEMSRTLLLPTEAEQKKQSFLSRLFKKKNSGD